MVERDDDHHTICSAVLCLFKFFDLVTSKELYLLSDFGRHQNENDNFLTSVPIPAPQR